MKVKELISQLQKLDQQLEVFCYTEDSVPNPQNGPSILDIVQVAETEGQLLRVKNEIPTVRFGKEPNSQAFAIIVVTSDM